MAGISFKDFKVLRMFLEKNDEYIEKNEQVKFDLGHSFDITGNQMVVQLFTGNKNDFPFKYEVIVQGIFEYNGDEDSANIGLHGFRANALAILFPYLRTVVSQMTTLSEYDPVSLPTINMIEYLKAADKA